MLLNKGKIAPSQWLWLVLVCLSFSVAATTNDHIIYEYDTITQKKGQSLTDALKNAKLSAYQKKLINNLPVLRKVDSDRQFRIIYAIDKGQRLIREVKVTRGNRTANFILTGSVGSHRFVSQASQISESQLKETPKLTSVGSTVKLISTEESLFSLTVTQNKGQSLSNALRPLNLSKLQRTIIDSGDFVKSALSQRKLKLYFAGSLEQKRLRGLTVTRGNNRADYFVSENKNGFHLRSLKTVKATVRQSVLKKFARASAKKTTTVASKTPYKKGNITDSGSYRLLRLTQGKGKSLASAMRPFSLTSAQRRLISTIPVIKTAKSTRYFYLLFEKQGGKKYLKAVRVVRGKNVAEFVLAKYQGKWTWANAKGKVTSSRGFLRYPLNFRRISSGFNLRRRHPITRRIRPHRGTDFKAAHGTPIWAPADGVVTFAGRQRGYGITLEIDHGNGYKTRYAHLSRIMKGARKGKRVKKRQIVARVGNTGFSTGTHLHYEVIVNGRARNPMTVRLPGGGGTKTLSSAKKAAARYLPQIRRMM